MSLIDNFANTFVGTSAVRVQRSYFYSFKLGSLEGKSRRGSNCKAHTE